MIIPCCLLVQPWNMGTISYNLWHISTYSGVQKQIVVKLHVARRMIGRLGWTGSACTDAVRFSSFCKLVTTYKCIENTAIVR
jgi:hypothetical protein